MSAGDVKKVELEGLKAWRRRVYPGGVAILSALFEALGLEHMTASSGALREGVMYDLLGRIRHEDVRVRTIRLFQERYQVDLRQAARVERNALSFLGQVAETWGIDAQQAGRFLTWATRLHEIGLAVAYAHHHRHGAYLIENADMPGFSRDDQALLAAIVGGHRRKLTPPTFAVLRGTRRELAIRLTVLLRLAVLTNRERSPRPVPPLRLTATTDGLEVAYPATWFEQNPLTQMDFEAEAAYLAPIGLTLTVRADG